MSSIWIWMEPKFWPQTTFDCSSALSVDLLPIRGNVSHFSSLFWPSHNQCCSCSILAICVDVSSYFLTLPTRLNRFYCSSNFQKFSKLNHPNSNLAVRQLSFFLIASTQVSSYSKKKKKKSSLNSQSNSTHVHSIRDRR